MQSEITKPGTGFVYLAHLLPADIARQITNLRINGITTIPRVRRVYPRGAVASQVLGMVGWNGHGSGGIEYRYNNVLEGTNGIRRVVDGGNGQTISINDLRATKPGKNVELTIDAGLQDEVEQVLAGVGTQYSAEGCDRDRDEPEQRRDPGARELAAGQRRTTRRTRPRARSRTRRSASTTSPARRSRRSRWRERSHDGFVTPSHDVRHPPAAPGRRPHDP